MDPLTQAIVEVRDWVYDHYPSAFVLGTFCIFYTMFMPDWLLFLIFWGPCLLLGLLLEPCVNPERLLYGPTICRLDGLSPKEKFVALTFDDGPGPDTPKLLGLLERFGVRATFFLIGEQIERNPEMVRQIAAAGHVIGNHTYSHLNLMTATPAKTEEELRKTQDLIVSLTGQLPSLFRPPFGYRAPWTAQVVKKLGLKQVTWTLNPRDFQEPGPGILIERIRRQVKPGHIVLLHDGRQQCPQTLEALEVLIPSLQEQGITFVPLAAEQGF